MIRVYPDTLNIHRHVHRLANMVTDTLVTLVPDEFSMATSLSECDCVITNAPAAPPYVFDACRFKELENSNKPVFVVNDADGAPPDCGVHPGMDPNYNFPRFVREFPNIMAYFYREWFVGYDRPDLKFKMLPFELVGVLHWNHPKDKTDYSAGIARDQFMARPMDVLFGQTCHVQSRQLMLRALQDRPRTKAFDLTRERLLGDQWMQKLRDAKITICLEGGGVKCQCHCEAPIASVMAMPDIAMHETYPWVDGINCIRLPYERASEGNIKGEGSLVHNYGRGLVDIPKSMSKVYDLLNNHERLWEILCWGTENARKYALPNYYREHVGGSIKKYL